MGGRRRRRRGGRRRSSIPSPGAEHKDADESCAEIPVQGANRSPGMQFSHLKLYLIRSSCRSSFIYSLFCTEFSGIWQFMSLLLKGAYRSSTKGKFHLIWHKFFKAHLEGALPFLKKVFCLFIIVGSKVLHVHKRKKTFGCVHLTILQLRCCGMCQVVACYILPDNVDQLLRL
jgi:hypothetical protein